MANILITGATGYIGSHVLKLLTKTQHNVVALSSKKEQPPLYIHYDIIENKGDIEGLMEKIQKPDCLIHLAYRNGFDHYNKTHLEDIAYHYNFIKNIIDVGCSNINVIGSMHEVGYIEGRIEDNCTCNPTNPYGIAKNALRQAITLLPASVKWLRAFYIYGDDFNSSSIFGKLYRANIKGIDSFNLTQGYNKFDFINVNDLAKLIIAASLQVEITGTINVCSGKPLSLREILKQYVQQENMQINLNFGSYPERKNEPSCIYGSVDKISRIVNLL